MPTRSVRALLALLLALALFAAACSSGDDGEADVGADDTSDDDAPDDTDDDSAADDSAAADTDDAPDPTVPDIEPFASYRGVTADTITVGVLTSDLDNLRELGLVDINNGDVEQIWNVLIDDFNANDGLLGRELEMVFVEYNPVFEFSADEACVKLTQDEEVFIVLGGVAGPAINRVLCFVEEHPTMMIGGVHTPAHFPRSSLPWISLGMASERRYRATLDLYEQQGLLEGNIGIFDDSSERPSLSEGVLIPALDDLGVEVTTHVTSTIDQGDEVALGDQARVFAERLQQDEIDTLLIVQSQIAFGVALMRENGFEGTILTIDNGETLSTIGGFDERAPETYDGAYGPMGLTRREVFDSSTTQECIDIVEAGIDGLEVLPGEDVADGDPNWLGGLLEPCRYLRMLRMVGEAAGIDLNPDSFRAAAEGLGSFELPGRPFASLAPGKLDADDTLRIGVFDSTIGESGALAPVTDATDIG